ncbi:MAG: folP [Bacteroidetes bacterium]|jgi:dihydropteroate synthase|nr:folP [Bacteroidota bacterium]
MSNKINEIKQTEYNCNGKSLTFIKPLLMGIVNVTPDSFYDGGKYDTVTDILRDVEEKVKNGADIIDIGAASSRPGSTEITEDEEWKRLEPVIREVRKNFPSSFISIDTYRSSIAKRSVSEGADIINDISAGDLDENMFFTVAKLNVPYILMHMQGTPKTMQVYPDYENVVTEVVENFRIKLSKLQDLDFDKIILDPGFGFGKNTGHNFSLLKHLNAIVSLGYPVLAGISRKSMINKVIGTNPVTSLNGTTVLNTIALMNGASILRVHDITEAKQAIELVEFYKNI